MISPLLIVFTLQGGVLSLADALRTAEEHQPQLRQAHAQTDAAWARADQLRAPLLPQVSANAGYARKTSNFVPGTVPGQARTVNNSFDTFNSFNFGVNATMLVYDFGLTTGKYDASKATAESQAATERGARLTALFAVRSAYFGARAQKALIKVARDTLANQERHLGQIQGFVEVGTRPEIDLAQARTDSANAKVQLINAESGYESAKALLNQAMGIEGPTDYEIADETLAAIPGEDGALDPLLGEAVKARPEIAAFDRQIQAQSLTLRSLKGAYAPSLGVSTSLTDAGPELGLLAWNWIGQVTLSWQIFQGYQTKSQQKEAEATLVNLEAQRDTTRQQVRLDVDQARIAVRGAKAALVASDVALVNAGERLRLAEGRYQTGVGNVIELGDAQVAHTQAAAQRVQAEYNLATARAQLVKALGKI